jgi:hypothetical protein
MYLATNKKALTILYTETILSHHQLSAKADFKKNIPEYL